MQLQGKNILRQLRRLAPVLVLTLWCAAVLSAQSDTATISGTVTDASGAAVVGAKIEVKNVGTGIAQARTSDNQGRYRVPELIVGNYEVQATQTGFQTVIHKGITVTVGGEAIIDFALPIGQAQQTVTVEAQASQVDTSSSAVATLVERTQMEDLPLNGRNFESLIGLAPGVITIPNSGGPFYGKSDNYSIAGSRPLGQQILIDDTNFIGFWGHATGSGAAGSSLGLEAIAEFQTLTNTYTAQFGGNGGVINASSKSGSNSFHGSAFEFLRNSAMDSRSPFDSVVLPGNTVANVPGYRRNQYGGSLGGPIKKDKAFFFVDYEGVRSAQGTSTVVTGTPDVNAHQGYLPCNVAGAAYASTCNASTNLAFVGIAPSIAPILALFPSVPASPTGSGNLTEVLTNIIHEDYVLARADYNLSDKDNIFVRYVRDVASYYSPQSVAPFVELDATSNNFATIEERHIFSPTLVNLAHVSFMRPTETQTQDSPQVPSLVFVPGRINGHVALTGGPNIGVGGPQGLAPNWLDPTHFVEGDDIIWTHGAHSIRAGVSLERVDDNETGLGTLGGTYTFPNLVGLLTAAPSQVSIPLQGETNGTRGLRTWFFAPYVQDEWKVNRRLTLNLGLRYEWGSNPREVNNLLTNVNLLNGTVTGTGYVSTPNLYNHNITNRNFAPRAGFAYDLFGDHKTSIRGGFGIFYQLLQAKDIIQAIWGSPPFVTGTANNPSFPNPFAGTGPAAPLPGTGIGIYDGSASTPLDTQYNLNIQRDLSKGLILTVGYTGSHGTHLLLPRDYNTPQLINGVWGTAGLNGTTTPNVRLNPNFSGFVMRNTVGNSNYNGLIVSLNRRFANHWQTQVSYTYSKSLDDGSAGQGAEAGPNAPNYPSNPYNAAIDYGRSSFDRTQAARISTIYEFPGRRLLLSGWRATGLYTRTTGAPFTIFSGFDRSGLGAGADARPNLVPGASPDPILGGPNEYFNPAAFSLQPVGTLGNLGRGTVSGPGFSNLDMAFFKNTPIRRISEVFNVQFRAELFNLPNHPNWGQPNQNVFNSGVGANGTLNPNAGRITSIIGTSRQIQLGIRIGF